MHTPTFEENLQEWAVWRDAHGYPPNLKEERRLAQWARNVQSARKGHVSMSLTPERLARLEEVQFQWTNPRKSMVSSYLKKPNIKQAWHLRRRREQLTAQEIAALDAVNFQWDNPVPKDWFGEFVQLLTEYKAQYGQCKGPFPFGSHLAILAHNVRQSKKQPKYGSRTLTPERIQILEEMGFTWVGEAKTLR